MAAGLRLMAGLLISLVFGQGFSLPDQIDFNIESKPMTAALVDLALQARVSIGHAGIDLHDVVANAVHGRLTTADALDTLLSGSGFEAVVVDPQTIAIRKIVASASPHPGSEIIQEVVVTATKQPAVAQSLPDSIVVRTGTDLDDRGATTSNDLAGQVAALTATNLGAGQDKLFIRGLSDSVFTGRSQSTVGLYLDQARVTDDAPDPGLRLVDIDRVEILRGPQGTLYGAGTLGGLIRIVTNQPQFDVTGGMAAVSGATTERGSTSGSADLALNIPIVPGSLALRLVGYLVSDGGYLDDTRLGLDDVNHTDTRGARASLRWLFADHWNATLAVTDQTIDGADAQYYQFGMPAFDRGNLVQEPHQDKFLQPSLTVEGPLAWGTLTSATSFTQRRIVDQYDASSEWPYLTSFPAGRSVFDDVRDIQSWTHETRLNTSTAGAWQWVAGLYLSTRDENYRSRLVGPNAAGVPLTALTQYRDDHASEAAIYGDASYEATPWLTLGAGARLFYSAVNAAATLTRLQLPSAPVSGSNDATGVTPKLTLSLRPSDSTTVYADAAEGFRLGGININGPLGATNVNGSGANNEDGPSSNAFASDQLWTYELGAKSSLLDGRFIANGAVFFTTWENAQSDQILPDGTLFIANVGNVDIPGIEADLDFQATPHLRFKGNAFWNDPKIVHANPLLTANSGRLPGVPEESFGVSVRYDFPIGEAYDVFTDLDCAYTGRSYVGFQQSPLAQMGNYYSSNVRLGVLRSEWRIVAYVDNLTDERANSFAYGNPFTYGRLGQITPLRPRTIGIGISRSF